MKMNIEMNPEAFTDSKTNEFKQELWVTGPSVSCVQVEAEYPAAKINTNPDVQLLPSRSLQH